MPLPGPPPPAPPPIAEPFDRRARRRHRLRAAAGRDAFDFLARAVAADLAERVAGEDTDMVLQLGAGPAVATGKGLTVVLDTAPLGDVVGDEDRLPFADASFDLIVSVADLHGVNDLPGALIQARRALRPGGRFVAGLFGGTSLIEVRRDLLDAESALTGRAAARIAPMVDPDAASGLMQRAGFADPVVEVDTVAIRYDGLFAVLRDLRGMGEGNALRSRVPLRRDVLAEAARRFAARAVDGRVAVTVQVLYLTGRAPG